MIKPIFIFSLQLTFLAHTIWASMIKSKGVIDMSFKKSYGKSYQEATKDWKNAQQYLIKRENGFELIELTNQQSFYSVDLEIGTPSQVVTVLVDTGSSDLWVTGSNNPYCVSNMDSGIPPQDRINCNTFGTFGISKSDTWRSNTSSPRFFISYGDTTFARGIWGQDRLHLDDLNITGLSFAVANQTNSTVGVLGIGLQGLEVTNTGTNTGYVYENFPMVLKNSGATESLSYSLYLNRLSEEHGSILFGGIDHSKYSGTLYTIPIINTLTQYGITTPIQIDVTLQGIGLSIPSSSSSNSNDNQEENITLTTTKLPALLDSGTTLTYLPQNILDKLAREVGATFNQRLGYYIVPCNENGTSSPSFDDNTQLIFDFGGFHINTTLSEYLISLTQSTCILGLFPGEDSSNAILGDTFLTHAYVVYDLETLEVGLAQAKFDVNEDDSDIEIIGSDGGIPSAVRAPGYSSTWSTVVRTTTSGGNIFTLIPHASKVSSANGSNNSGSETSASTSTESHTQTGEITGTTTRTESTTSEDSGRSGVAVCNSVRTNNLVAFVFFTILTNIPINLL